MCGKKETTNQFQSRLKQQQQEHI